MSVYWVALARWEELQDFAASNSLAWPLEATKEEAFGAFVAAFGLTTQRFGVPPWCSVGGPCDLDSLHKQWFPPPPPPPPPPLPLPAPAGFAGAWGACQTVQSSAGAYISTPVGVMISADQCEAFCLSLPGDTCEAFGWDARGIWCGAWSTAFTPSTNMSWSSNGSAFDFTYHHGTGNLSKPVCKIASKGTGWCWRRTDVKCAE